MTNETKPLTREETQTSLELAHSGWRDRVLALLDERDVARARAARLREVAEEATNAIDLVESEPGAHGPIFKIDWTRALKVLRDTEDDAAWLAEREKAAVARFVAAQERSVADALLDRVRAEARREALEEACDALRNGNIRPGARVAAIQTVRALASERKETTT